MFNYQDTRILGKRRILIQLDNSEWSDPISIDSVGTPFAAQVEQPEMDQLLEIGYKIKLAPGRLAKYTKIVRLMPRFIFENKIALCKGCWRYTCMWYVF
jgi:hypothetical protein